MARKFDYFVIFAEMRTGSNFLERNLGEFKDINMYGEAFNPDFIGRPNWPELFGQSMEARDADPKGLLTNMAAQARALPGFRFFFDHEPRVIDEMLENPRCGKVVLTRNPLDSYVSVKLASKTDQWILTDMKDAKRAMINFDLQEFEAHLDRLQEFQLRILRGCQVTGQAPFYINYDDINDVAVLNGLARYLGSEDQLEDLQRHLKPQNPAPMTEKVRNYDEMKRQLAKLDRFDLSRTPQFEPRRPPSVPTYFATPGRPLLFLPIRGGPVEPVLDWMAALDGCGRDELVSGMTQNSLKEWKRDHEGLRSFAVLRHPVERAHATFCQYILSTEKGAYLEIRRRLRKKYNLPIPEGAVGADYSAEKHRIAFIEFLEFLRGNLAGQTAIRVDSAWATQTEVLRGMAEVSVPDRLIREEELTAGLAELARAVGVDPTGIKTTPPAAPQALEKIYDEKIEAATRRVYQRDYLNFGFADWG
ncbi:nodulation protein NodH [Brevirhabdus pacifica]|uniref:Nodulation protein NodH n=1 Tax=Brevirhabdus pacifica TaxID=1267768 RepID=A0A1U7DIT4_9RHOB|nr:sulfotransferase family 2 domain-containing protein [Brevirhabdus pacifica]APX89881.1 nodulation protein NodH [Brevirhabdus pacifica]OWU74401.1 nodulation protein NodH [Loktanella sp. 22II-4b]PJJ82897.1 hypothetical protein CLV77_2674 [Brevirhabdus pacifica]